MATLKQTLKSIRLLRETKYALQKACQEGIFGVCQLLKQLPVSSKVLGPPKGYVSKVADFVEQYNQRTGGNQQIYHALGSGHVHLQLFEKVFGDRHSYTHQEKEYPYSDFLATLKPARVLWDLHCVISADDRLLTEVSSWWGDMERKHKVFYQLKLPKVYTLKGTTFLLGGTHDEYYAHFITETLPKFKLLSDCGMDIRSFDHILMFDHQNAFQQEMIRHFNLPTEKIVYANHYRHIEAESLTVAPIFWRQRPWISDYLKSVFLKNNSSATTGNRRLYISRCRAKSRRVVNEEQVMAVLARHGFEYIVNENYSIAQQAELFSQAEIVLGSHGAGLTNIVFCNPGTKVIELRIEQYEHFHLDYFAVLSQHGHLHHYLQLCQAAGKREFTETHDLDLIVDTGELKHLLSYVLEEPVVLS